MGTDGMLQKKSTISLLQLSAAVKGADIPFSLVMLMSPPKNRKIHTLLAKVLQNSGHDVSRQSKPRFSTSSRSFTLYKLKITIICTNITVLSSQTMAMTPCHPVKVGHVVSATCQLILIKL